MRRSLVFVILVSASLLCACAQVRFAGGGSLPGASGGKATLTLNGENCGMDDQPWDGEYVVTGRLSLTDKMAQPWSESGGVKLTGTFEKFMDCSALYGVLFMDILECTPPEDIPPEMLAELEDVCMVCVLVTYSLPTTPLYGVKFAYTSNNKDFPSGGVGHACFTGTVGRGPQVQPNEAAIMIDDGDYADYTTDGVFQGTLNTTNCPAPKSAN